MGIYILDIAEGKTTTQDFLDEKTRNHIHENAHLWFNLMKDQTHSASLVISCGVIWVPSHFHLTVFCNISSFKLMQVSHSNILKKSSSPGCRSGWFRWGRPARRRTTQPPGSCGYCGDWSVVCAGWPAGWRWGGAPAERRIPLCRWQSSGEEHHHADRMRDKRIRKIQNGKKLNRKKKCLKG